MALPARDDDCTYKLRRPAELVEPIGLLLKMAEAEAPRHELMSAFSAVKAAFGATIETVGMARRRDIAELLELHDRILLRAEMRPDLRLEATLTPIDEDALIALEDDSGSTMPAP